MSDEREKNRYPDREVFSYQQTLELPSFLPPLPIIGEKKVSWLFYLLFDFAISMLICWKILFFLSFLVSFGISVLVTWFTADFISDLKIDGKFFHRYVIDVILNWWHFGRKRKTHYLTKGMLVKKYKE